MHLSQRGSMSETGYYGKGKKMDFAVIEVTKILEDGTAIPSSSWAPTTSTSSMPTRSSSR